MGTSEFEITAFPSRDYRELNLGHRNANRQLARMQRIATAGHLANEMATRTAEYTMCRLNEELQRVAKKIEAGQSLTPYQSVSLERATFACMIKLGYNAVDLDGRLMEILRR